MDRERIKQRVLDVLGIILVDKSQIHEDATFETLMLDEDDTEELFRRLEELFACRFPAFIRERARRRPEYVSLPMIVDLIVLMQQEPRPHSHDKPAARSRRRP